MINVPTFDLILPPIKISSIALSFANFSRVRSRLDLIPAGHLSWLLEKPRRFLATTSCWICCVPS
jgi:hypothetical protein